MSMARVGILMGRDSDWPKIKGPADAELRARFATFKQQLGEKVAAKDAALLASLHGSSS